MDTKVLQAKSDKQLNQAIEFLKNWLIQNGETLEDIEADIEEYLPRQYYRARKPVKICKILIENVVSKFSKLHIQVTQETLQWSDMEDTRFNTFDESGFNQLMKQAFA